MQIVNQPVRKKDAMQLVTGQPVYMDDMIPEDCLIVKLLRSPHANAVVQEIQTDKAMKVPGIEAIYTWKDIDQNGRRFTCAGQTYPEPSPYDRLILDPSCQICRRSGCDCGRRDRKSGGQSHFHDQGTV